MTPLVAIVFGIGLFAAWLLWGSPDVANDLNRETLERLVENAGAAGPVVIVGLMILAVVASPLPSAPIALAAGAAYGHTWGTPWVILGAETGAVCAFVLARALGREAIERRLGKRIERGFLGSQNALTLVVFASRLMPFISSDLVSYVAGLSTIRPWRFALATLAGIAPASFLLAHLGTQAAQGGLGTVDWALALGLGAATGAPLIWAALRGDRKAEEDL
ncbi:putative membrane protein YdjX (TVP38/TMEM64 family) [Maritimibacter alkaliphilus HTCC2654]|nr:putative membrane protein YdjX (TVP38/TMEM64 family) [Maritimibacter alkaliphilus HTCC2654]